MVADKNHVTINNIFIYKFCGIKGDKWKGNLLKAIKKVLELFWR